LVILNGLKIVGSGIGQLSKMFGVVLDNSQKCSELYWTTPKNFGSGIGQLGKLFIVVQYHSEKLMAIAINFLEWYWTTLKNVWSGIL